MDDEIAAIERNNTWEMVDLQSGQQTIEVKWIYKTKLKENGEIDKYKARLVTKGYKQKYGVDYKEIFALVVRLDTVKLVVALAAQSSWPIFQMDVKSTFLYGDLKEQVFIDQPLSYVKHGCEHQVYKLKKALYELKQAPRAWYNCIDAYLKKVGFKKCPHKHTLYVKDGGKIIIVCLYVDDLIFTGNHEGLLLKFKESMIKEFDMSDLGLMYYFLGIEVKQVAAGTFISQKKYGQEILDRFGIKNCNASNTHSEVGMKLEKDLGRKNIDNTYYK